MLAGNHLATPIIVITPYTVVKLKFRARLLIVMSETGDELVRPVETPEIELSEPFKSDEDEDNCSMPVAKRHKVGLRLAK